MYVLSSSFLPPTTNDDHSQESRPSSTASLAILDYPPIDQMPRNQPRQQRTLNPSPLPTACIASSIPPVYSLWLLTAMPRLIKRPTCCCERAVVSRRCKIRKMQVGSFTVLRLINQLTIHPYSARYNPSCDSGGPHAAVQYPRLRHEESEWFLVRARSCHRAHKEGISPFKDCVSYPSNQNCTVGRCTGPRRLCPLHPS